MPAISALVVGPRPANGTCTILIPAAAFISSTPMCGALPTPALPKLSFSGFALAWATSSAIDFTGTLALTATANGDCRTPAMKAKSSGILYGTQP